MTAFLNPLRLCLRTARQAPVLRGNRLAAFAIKTSFHPASRRLATSEAHDDAIEEDDDGDGHDGYSDDNLGEILAEISRDPTLSDEERKEVTAALRTYKDASKAEHRQRQEQGDGSLGDDSLGDDFLGDVSLGVNDMVEDFTHDLDPLRRPVKPKRDTFWHEDETDEDLITDEIGEDEFDEDDILSMAHGKLEEHREAREYARVAVWEMPLLSKLAKPFEPPSQDQPLRFRYTSYMGEFHPAERKVVVEFSPNDLPLNSDQRHKLKKLCGARYNPEKNIIKTSCDMFEHPAQNKRYLGDLVDKLVEEAKNSADMFADVPLDLRHHKVKVKPKFPSSWIMSDSRRQELQALRNDAFLRDRDRNNNGTLVDGKQIVAKALERPPGSRTTPELVTLGPAARVRGRPMRR